MSSGLTTDIISGIILLKKYVNSEVSELKTALVTGGSRGIGRAVVEELCKKGYRVAFTYKNSEKEAKSLAEATGAISIKADSAIEAEVVGAVKQAYSQLGKIDCLVNNAGVSSFSLFTDITLEEWNRIFSVNVTGAFLYSREVSRYMISEKSGRIINISSIWGLVGSSCEVHYSASKAALIGMTKALAKELGLSGITVNAVAPGLIDTEMNSSLSEDTVRELIDETPLMRIGLPSDVARTVLYLASDAADFVTGQVLNVSGGFVID